MRLSQRATRIKPSATLTINAKAKALKQKGVKVISFGVGEPDFDTPLHIQAAAIEAIRDGHTRYTAVSGINELRDAIVDTVQKDYGLTYRRDNVLVSCGGKHALYNLFQTLLDPDDEVIIPAPFWVSYPDMVELTGAKSVEVPTREIDGFKLRPEQLEKVLTPKTRMLILNSPSNPTGAHYRRDELDALAETILRHNLTVLSDDIYYRILFDGQEWVNMAMLGERLKERTFIANGVSKSYCMTGWRIGYLVGDAAVLSAASKIQSQSTSNPCSIAQWASVAALNGPQEDVEKMVQIFQERCSYVLKRLAEIPGVTCYKPNGAFYVFPNFSCTFGKSVDGRVIKGSLDLADYLMEKANVAVVPGSAFGEDSCLRFSYAISMEELTEGFDRISRAIAALK
ncbi:MAG TPA: aspartate aminotransferase [Syntrophobacteraceae bacterium]|jgi:aspartate aminotransferase|nr:aspartate aminotransferase [Syntrophobacteraceae bacterium]HBZ57487.1 aspartate aminotransferase [Syntrophobacteraceae bacterium]